MDIEYRHNVWSGLPEECTQAIVACACYRTGEQPFKTRLALALLSHCTLAVFEGALKTNDLDHYFDEVAKDSTAPTLLCWPTVWHTSLPLRLASMSTAFYAKIRGRLDFLREKEPKFLEFVYRHVGKCDVQMRARDYNRVKEALKKIARYSERFQNHEKLQYYMAVQRYGKESMSVPDLTLETEPGTVAMDALYVYNTSMKVNPAQSVIVSHDTIGYDLQRCIPLRRALSEGVPAHSRLLKVSGTPRGRNLGEYWRERVQQMELLRRPLDALVSHGKALKKKMKNASHDQPWHAASERKASKSPRKKRTKTARR